MMTTGNQLRRLTSVEFETENVASTPAALRRLLARRPEVHRLQEAYTSGCLPDEQVQRFVNDLLREGVPCHRFPYQIALASIAVMLEPSFTLFADDYLHDLARIHSERFSIAARVARACLDARTQRIGTHVRHFPPQAAMHLTCQWTMPPDSEKGQYTVGEADQSANFQVA